MLCRVTTLPQDWKTNLTFVNNTAGQRGQTIFASSLHPCRKFYADDTFLYTEPFHYLNLTKDAIATSPMTFTNKYNKSISAIPGKIFDLNLELVDELGCSANATSYIATCGSLSPHVVEPYQFTSGLIQIAGRPGEACQLHIQTETDYPVTTTMFITLKNCPPGWEFDNSRQKCECSKRPTDANHAIQDCEMTSFQAYFNNFY